MEVVNRSSDGVTGDLITTCLHNYAVPLIRYDPGDIVKWCGYQDSDSPYPWLNCSEDAARTYL